MFVYLNITMTVTFLLFSQNYFRVVVLSHLFLHDLGLGT